MTPEMILLEDQSQPLPSPSVSVAIVIKILDVHVSYGEGLRRRRGSVYVQTFTEEYELPAFTGLADKVT